MKEIILLLSLFFILVSSNKLKMKVTLEPLNNTLNNSIGTNLSNRMMLDITTKDDPTKDDNKTDDKDNATILINSNDNNNRLDGDDPSIATNIDDNEINDTNNSNDLNKKNNNDDDDNVDDDDNNDDDDNGDDDTAYYAFIVQLTNTEDGKKILVDASGYPLYTYSNDKGTSNCHGPCASRWPPLIVDGNFDLKALPPLNKKDFTLIPRRDGFTQLSFKNAPLYYSTKDKIPNTKPKGEGNKENNGIFSAVKITSN